MFEVINVMEENHKLITATVNLNNRLREATKEYSEEMTPSDYAESFCSVYIDIGRMTGKTEWIKKNQTKSDLIIVETVKVGEIMFPSVKSDVLSLKQIVNKDELKYYRNIYFDNSRWLNKKHIESAYEKLAKENKEQTFIHLG